MANKKANKAAGLAALAGLAYMASRGKESASASDRDDADTYTGSRAPRKQDEELNISGEGGFNAPADMSMVPRSGTPSPSVRTTPSVRTAPTETTPPARKESPEGAFRGMRSDTKPVGGGRSTGRGGPEAGEAAAYLAKNPKKTGTGSAGSRGPAFGEEAAYRAKQSSKANIGSDGGKAEADRQNAEIAKLGMTPAQYLRSGKAEIDRQDRMARAAKDITTPENKDVTDMTFKRGGSVKKMASGGMTSATSKRGDGIASKGKTRCKMY